MQYFQSLVDIRKQKSDNEHVPKPVDLYPLIISVKNKNLKIIKSQSGSKQETRDVSDIRESSLGEDTNITCSELNSLTRDDCLSLPDKSAFNSLTFQQSPGPRNVTSSLERTDTSLLPPSEEIKTDFSFIDQPAISFSEVDINLKSQSEIHTDLEISSDSLVDQSHNTPEIVMSLSSEAEKSPEKDVDGKKQNRIDESFSNQVITHVTISEPQSIETLSRSNEFVQENLELENRENLKHMPVKNAERTEIVLAEAAVSEPSEMCEQNMIEKVEAVVEQENSIQMPTCQDEKVDVNTHVLEMSEMCPEKKETIKESTSAIGNEGDVIIVSDKENYRDELGPKDSTSVDKTSLAVQSTGDFRDEATIKDDDIELDTQDESNNRVSLEQNQEYVILNNIPESSKADQLDQKTEFLVKETNSETNIISKRTIGNVMEESDSIIMTPEDWKKEERVKDSILSTENLDSIEIISQNQEIVEDKETEAGTKAAEENQSPLEPPENKLDIKEEQDQNINPQTIEIGKKDVDKIPSEETKRELDTKTEAITSGNEVTNKTTSVETETSDSNDITVKTTTSLQDKEGFMIHIEEVTLTLGRGQELVVDPERGSEIITTNKNRDPELKDDCKLSENTGKPRVQPKTEVESHVSTSQKESAIESEETVSSLESKPEPLSKQDVKRNECVDSSETKQNDAEKDSSTAKVIVDPTNLRDNANETVFNEVPKQVSSPNVHVIHCEPEKSIEFDRVMEQVNTFDYVEEIEELKIFHEIMSSAVVSDSLNLDSGQLESNKTLSSETIEKSGEIIPVTNDVQYNEHVAIAIAIDESITLSSETIEKCDGMKTVTNDAQVMENVNIAVDESAMDNNPIEKSEDIPIETNDIQVSEPSAKNDGQVNETAVRNDALVNEPAVIDDAQFNATDATNDVQVNETDVTNDALINETAVMDDAQVKETDVTDDTQINEIDATNDNEVNETDVTNDTQVKETAVTNVAQVNETDVINDALVIETDVTDDNQVSKTDVTIDAQVKEINVTNDDTQVKKTNLINDALINKTAVTDHALMNKAAVTDNAQVNDTDVTELDGTQVNKTSVTNDTQVKETDLINDALVNKTAVTDDALINKAAVTDNAQVNDTDVSDSDGTQVNKTGVTNDTQVKETDLINDALVNKTAVTDDALINETAAHVKETDVINASLVNETDITDDAQVNETDVTNEVQVNEIDVTNEAPINEKVVISIDESNVILNSEGTGSATNDVQANERIGIPVDDIQVFTGFDQFLPKQDVPVMISKVIEIKQLDSISDEESLQHVQATDVSDDEKSFGGEKVEGMSILEQDLPFRPVIITKVVEARIVTGSNTSSTVAESTRRETEVTGKEPGEPIDEHETEGLSKISTGSRETIYEELIEEQDLIDANVPEDSSLATQLLDQSLSEELEIFKILTSFDLIEDSARSTPVVLDFNS
ncbi:hypothetical protein WDU94_013159 [Cyamophila willieti]